MVSGQPHVLMRGLSHCKKELIWGRRRAGGRGKSLFSLGLPVLVHIPKES